MAGQVGALSGLAPERALHLVYITMTGSAIAAQRLLALDPAEVTVVTFSCRTVRADRQEGHSQRDLSDPLLNALSSMTSAMRPVRFLKGKAWQRIPIPTRTPCPARPRRVRKPGEPLRIGVGGPVGSGKTARMAALCQLVGELSLAVLIATSTPQTRLLAHMRCCLNVAAGGCPHRDPLTTSPPANLDVRRVDGRPSAVD